MSVETSKNLCLDQVKSIKQLQHNLMKWMCTGCHKVLLFLPFDIVVFWYGLRVDCNVFPVMTKE